MPTLYSVARARFAQSTNDTRSAMRLRTTVSLRPDGTQLHAAGVARKSISDGFARRPMKSSDEPTRERPLLERVRKPDVIRASGRIGVRRVVADLARERLIRERRCAIEKIVDAERDRRVERRRVARLDIPDVVVAHASRRDRQRSAGTIDVRVDVARLVRIGKRGAKRRMLPVERGVMLPPRHGTVDGRNLAPERRCVVNAVELL